MTPEQLQLLFDIHRGIRLPKADPKTYKSLINNKTIYRRDQRYHIRHTGYSYLLEELRLLKRSFKLLIRAELHGVFSQQSCQGLTYNHIRKLVKFGYARRCQVNTQAFIFTDIGLVVYREIKTKLLN